MTNELITEVNDWFKQAVPTPTDASRRVQVGVHFEEFAETCRALGMTDLADNVTVVADRLKRGEIDLPSTHVNRIELLDGLCDQIVTSVGVAHMFALDITGGLDEVNQSNWSKFNNGVAEFDANGKITKCKASYFKSDLTEFV